MAKRPMIDRTFVRVGRENQSVREMTDIDFLNWVVEWYARRGLHYRSRERVHAAEQREEILAQMVRNGCSPFMLRD